MVTNKHKLSLFSIIFLFVSISLSNPQNKQTDHPGQIPDDSSLIASVASQKNAYYVEAGNLIVAQVLPDDTSGLPHQKWTAKLSNGAMITVVYNADMGDRVPVQVGKKFGVGGQFIWTGHGGLVHWVHDDPKGIRPDGYVFMDGIVYGDTDHEDQKN